MVDPWILEIDLASLDDESLVSLARTPHLPEWLREACRRERIVRVTHDLCFDLCPVAGDISLTAWRAGWSELQGDLLAGAAGVIAAAGSPDFSAARTLARALYALGFELLDEHGRSASGDLRGDLEQRFADFFIGEAVTAAHQRIRRRPHAAGAADEKERVSERVDEIGRIAEDGGAVAAPKDGLERLGHDTS